MAAFDPSNSTANPRIQGEKAKMLGQGLKSGVHGSDSASMSLGIHANHARHPCN